MEAKELAAQLRRLVIFKNLRSDPLVQALGALLDSAGDPAEGFCQVAAQLYPQGGDLSQALMQRIQEDDNFYVRACAGGQHPCLSAQNWLGHELDTLQQAALSSDAYRRLLNTQACLPEWTAQPVDFAADYAAMLENAPRRGYGVFARHAVFSLEDGGVLQPVVHPDPQSLSTLYGYDVQREKVLANTQALLRGLPANNVLLYGDAGTGKSSTVKAIVNQYAHEGLRLVQVEKSRLHLIPQLLGQLSENPLKFILFIDDLSFSSDDRDFTALKTVLEGSVSARSANTVVYATSNRRHLVKETMSARQGDEIHLSDTLEEVSSLSARFGLVITFEKPDRDLYQEQVRRLAKQIGLKMPETQLLQEAEAFAIRAGGRSPRVARQYVEYKIGRIH